MHRRRLFSIQRLTQVPKGYLQLVSDGGSDYTILRTAGDGGSDIVISDSGRQKIQVGGHGFPVGGQFGSR